MTFVIFCKLNYTLSVKKSDIFIFTTMQTNFNNSFVVASGNGLQMKPEAKSTTLLQT